MGISYQWTLRDAVQSLMATRPSAGEIIEFIEGLPPEMFSQIQSGGGTFFDLFYLNGRNEWEEVEKLLTYFKEKGITQSALIRGDMLFGYKPYEQHTINALVLEYAEIGMNVLQNFHGMNDSNFTAKVARAVKNARRKGHNIVAQGVICIEDNPNVTIESCMAHARELIKQGHKGFYLKSASGVVKPELIAELMEKLYEEFPEQKVGVHVHSTYGYAEACYIAAAEVAADKGIELELDVQHPSLSGNTGQPSVVEINEMLLAHPDPKVQALAKELDMDAIEAMADSLARFRYEYNDTEVKYSPRLLAAMEKARAAGGASAAVKKIPGLLENLQATLGTDDWEEIQIAIYEMQAKILPNLGDPTQVTPYAFFTAVQAAYSILSEKQGKGLFGMMRPEIISYLTGGIGKVPKTANPELVAQASKMVTDDRIKVLTEQANMLAAQFNTNSEEGSLAEFLANPENLTQDKRREMTKARKELIKSGIENPTVRQVLSAVILKDGIAHVVDCANDNNNPNPRPALPNWTKKIDVAPIERMAQDVFRLKQYEDGHIKLQSSHDSFKKERMEQLRMNIAESYKGFMEILKLDEKKLQAIQGMAEAFNDDYLNRIVYDVVEGKGQGMHNFLMVTLRKQADFKLERSNINRRQPPKNEGGSWIQKAAV